MSMSKLLTRAEFTEYLKGLSRSDLEDNAQALGLVIGGSGKDGNVTKGDLVQAVGAKLINNPTHYRVENIDVPYHNGTIVDKLGCDWKVGHTRVLPVWAFSQVAQDVGTDRVADKFRVVDKLYAIDLED